MTRQICVAAGAILLAVLGSAVLADESQDAQTQELTDKIHQLDKRVKQLEGIAAKSRSASLRKRFEARLKQDHITYTQQELNEIESLYQIANKQWNSPEAKESLKKLIEKYSKANRTGCALLYLGQMASGEEQENYLKRAIDEFSDCWYGDGVQVGAYARFYLANHYLRKGKIVEASAIFDEIQKNYPDAINHSGRLLVDTLSNRAGESKTDEIGKTGKVKKTRKIILTKNYILILPLVILVVAIIYRLFLPKQINRFYGYRTKLSMKNQDTWDVANKFSANVLLIGAVAYLLFVMLCVLVYYALISSLWISAVSLILMLFGVIFITEWRLIKIFDASGNRINADKDSRITFNDLSTLRKIGLVGTVVVMAVLLVYIAYLMRYFFVQAINGEIFIARFDRYHPGYGVGAIEARFFAFTLLAAVGFSYLGLIQWITGRGTKLSYWAFVVQAIAICLYSLIPLTSALYRHLLYINAYGFTTLRICGLVYVLGGYILILWILCWAVRMPNKMRKEVGQDASSNRLLDRLPKLRKVGVFGTIVSMTIIFIPLVWFAYPFVVQILSGQIFARHFNPDGYGSASEPIGIPYVLFTFFSAAVLPYVAVVRWISIRKTQLEYWTFALLTIIVCLCLISILTGGFYNLLLYIHAMGYTPKSILGLLYGLGGYILILGFLYWAIRKPKEEKKA